MSGFAGVWLLGPNGAAAPGRSPGEPRVLLATQAAALGRRGGGPPHSLWQPPVGMVFRPFDAGDPAALLPLPGGGLAAWDGRLDNGDEIARRLGVEPIATTDPGADLPLVLTAYVRWGEEALERLEGDWALAFWEPAQRRLILARDPIGTRPLFYRHLPQRGCFWGSTLEAATPDTGPPDELDEEWIAGYLTGAIPTGVSPFPGIRPVPPGSLVTVRPDGVARRELWSPVPGPELHYRDDREYEEHYRELFYRSVRRRLRTAGPVGADLSGGLDSSSIVAAACELLDLGEAAATDVVPVSFVYDESRTADERRYIRKVEARTGRRTHAVVQERFPLFAGFGEPTLELPRLAECTKARDLEVVRHLRQRGARVWLRGLGGDELLWSEADLPVELADLLLRGRLGRLPGAFRDWATAFGAPYPQLAWVGMIRPLLPRSLRGLLGRRPAVPPWIDSSFARRTHLRERLDPEARLPPGLDLPSRRIRLMELEGARELVSWEYDRGPRAIDLAYPFLDRSLVEHCLALPFRQLVRGTETRSIHRRAVASRIVPPEILARRAKTSMREAILRGIRASWPLLEGIFPRPLVAERGWVDPRPLRQALERARFGGDAPGSSLLTILALESWLRGREQTADGHGAHDLPRLAKA